MDLEPRDWSPSRSGGEWREPHLQPHLRTTDPHLQLTSFSESWTGDCAPQWQREDMTTRTNGSEVTRGQPILDLVQVTGEYVPGQTQTLTQTSFIRSSSTTEAGFFRIPSAVVLGSVCTAPLLPSPPRAQMEVLINRSLSQMWSSAEG